MSRKSIEALPSGPAVPHAPFQLDDSNGHDEGFPALTASVTASGLSSLKTGKKSGVQRRIFRCAFRFFRRVQRLNPGRRQMCTGAAGIEHNTSSKRKKSPYGVVSIRAF